MKVIIKNITAVFFILFVGSLIGTLFFGSMVCFVLMLVLFFGGLIATMNAFKKEERTVAEHRGY